MKAYEKIGILLHQSHCSIVPENTALLFPNLLHFIFPKSLYFFFLFTVFFSSTSFCAKSIKPGTKKNNTVIVSVETTLALSMPKMIMANNEIKKKG